MIALNLLESGLELMTDAGRRKYGFLHVVISRSLPMLYRIFQAIVSASRNHEFSPV